jgi:3-deoxy-7-phosphoheptulonate synthase
MLKTAGNSDAHIILRGGKSPNYDEDSINQTLTALKEAEVNESIMVDASHGNSQKKFKEQINVIKNIGDQVSSGNHNLKGVMIESHINEGNQSISSNLKYGQSITDACINLDDTSKCLEILNKSVSDRREK